jgi:excinuclease ABC subunit C
MRETSLTDIPGVGPTRARILLRRFGSLAGLAAADPRDVVAAVGPATARAVSEYLADSPPPIAAPEAHSVTTDGDSGVH